MPPAFLFRVSPSAGVPIYRQVIEQVEALSASARLKPGDFLPSVRQVADELQINPMTVSKAYSLLERDGLVELVRGQGMRVLERAPVSLRARLDDAMPDLLRAAARARSLGLTLDQTMQRLRQAWQEIDHER